jgi:hypothetical protein
MKGNGSKRNLYTKTAVLARLSSCLLFFILEILSLGHGARR